MEDWEVAWGGWVGMRCVEEMSERGGVMLGEDVVLEPNLRLFLAPLSHSFNMSE